MKISILGTGYVGLVTGACFSDTGNHVTCVDVDANKIDRLQKGHVPFYEPGLEEIVHRNIKAKRLVFTTDVAAAIKNSEFVFMAVGTPAGENGMPNLTYLMRAVESVVTHGHEGLIVVMKSTVTVGTAAEVKAVLQKKGKNFEVVSNPEFLKEGSAVNDFLRPERVVIGSHNERAIVMMKQLYAPFVRSGNPILVMGHASAELCKYAANAFLAMKISFINTMASLSDRLGADVQDVRRAMITDSRIGSQFLYPGVGYGGSCFPKDVLALVHVGMENECNMELISQVHEVNERQKRVLFDKLHQHFKGNLKGKTIGVWGLSFKPMTDDMREAPAVTMIQLLLKAGAKVVGYDPVAKHEATKIFGNQIQLVEDAYLAVKGADALAVITEWNEFRTPDFRRIKEDMKTPVLLDGRDLYDLKFLKDQGFHYYGIGR